MPIILSRKPGSGGGGTEILQSTVTDISSAQILALFTTPVELVPAPGVGQVLVPLGFLFQLKFVTTAYVPVSDQLNVNYGNAANLVWFIGGLLAQVASAVGTGLPLGDLISQANAVNQPLTLAADGGNPTLGDGTLRVVIYYSVMTLA